MLEPETQTNTIETTELAAEIATPDEKRFTQADMDRVVQERLARVERRGAQKDRPRASEAPQSHDEKLSLKQLSETMLTLTIDREFDRLALREKLSVDQADRLMPLYRAARAAAADGWDGAAWIRDIRAAFGQGPVTSTPARPATPSGPPASDAGGPAAPATYTEDTPLWQLKPEDRMHLIKSKGPAWYANTLRSQLKGTRVQLRKP